MIQGRAAARAAGALVVLLGLLAGGADAAVPRLPVILVYGFQPAPGFLPCRAPDLQAWMWNFSTRWWG